MFAVVIRPPSDVWRGLPPEREWGHGAGLRAGADRR